MSGDSKKRALIVFPDEWIAYSPTILNLYTCLKPDYEVRIICFQLEIFDNPLQFEDLQAIRINKLRYKLLRRINRYKWYKNLLLSRVMEREGQNEYDLVIGVDAMGYNAARQYWKDVVFLSLEVANNPLMEEARNSGIKDLIIQSVERKEFLLGKNSSTRVHYIQNAPILTRAPQARESFRNRLVYFGNIKPYYGIDHIIESMRYLPKEYTLTLKGIEDPNYTGQLIDAYQDIIDEGRLIFDHDYIPQEAVIEYLSDFDLGFCLFDFRFGNENNFNYLSSPSGKMFNYFAAGLPVIGNDIVGFRPIRDYEAGMLLEEITPSALSRSVQVIKLDYEVLSKNAVKAANDFDFQKGFDSFISTIHG